MQGRHDEFPLAAALAVGMVLAGLAASAWPAPAAGADQQLPPDFRSRRQELFEFTAAPTIAAHGDRVEIRFTSKAFCDATVAVQDGAGRIVRHLASGVLGPNAPAPFQKDSLAQLLVWDGKDDRSQYLPTRDGCTVRVSLGLAPRFERTLFWSPYKRVAPPTKLSFNTPVMTPAPEGVYVAEGGLGDFVRLFDHDGRYLRTIYPFPADNLTPAKTQGLRWATFPQDGRQFPLKWSLPQMTLLTGGKLDYGGKGWPTGGSDLPAATSMAVRGTRIALANVRMNRLASDGTTGGLPLGGPMTSFTVTERDYLHAIGPRQVGPRSAAISPDGQWLYMTGYWWPESWGTGGTRHRWLDGVARARIDGAPDAAAELFLGTMKFGAGGTDDKSFHAPMAVACDDAGLIYVADYMNDRVQVYRSDGSLVRSIRATKPADIAIDVKRKTLYVFSWLVINPWLERVPRTQVKPTLTQFAPLDDPRPVGQPIPLPLPGGEVEWNTWDHLGGTQYRVALDPWADTPRVWIAGGTGGWGKEEIQVYKLEAGRLTLGRDFAAEARQAVAQLRPPHFGRQRLYCDPRTGLLYVGEQHLPSVVLSKSIRDLVAIDPRTGAERIVPLPFDAEDLTFDLQGLAYLRIRDMVVRYQPSDPFAAGDDRAGPWREVPFDYGEERRGVSYSGFRGANVVAGIVARGGNWVSAQLGGLSVSPRGHLAVTFDIRGKLDSRLYGPKGVYAEPVKAYQPQVFPGRAVIWTIHVFDEHGQLVREDALPGMGIVSSIGLDSDDNLYALASAQRLWPSPDGGPPRGYLNDAAGTLIKAPAGKVKVLSAGGVVPMGALRPDRPADVRWHAGPGLAWIEGASWLYGGVGFDSHGIVAQIRACHCQAIGRFTLDGFARAFAPEINRYDVAVIDSAGNTICRIGRFGSVDDGIPLVAGGGPAHPRDIGGDQVAIVHGANVAVDTDRRLFISDVSNARILSVRLGYHRSVSLPLPPAD